MAETIRQITTPKVPEPPNGIYTNCLAVGGLVFVSGMTAGDGKGGIAGDGSAFDQSRQCLQRIQGLLEAAGGTMSDIVKMTVFLTDIRHRPDFARARAEFIKGRMPCSTLIAVSALAEPGLLVEVEAVAAVGAG